jgi:tetratricopeptide (TPR) repeat protein
VDYKIPYADIEKEWQGFNYVFVVIYPPDQQEHLNSILGDYTDEEKANRISLDKASAETSSKIGADQFFAWYNRGTSLVALQDYVGAAGAYDQAFTYLASLPEDQVPKKIMRVVWYQTGPYFAYFYAGRYQDVINLADQALSMPAHPYLEESWYWKARAKVALGDNAGAVADLQESLKYHEGFPPSVDLLQQLGY